jgi:hypothetical protein
MKWTLLNVVWALFHMFQCDNWDIYASYATRLPIISAVWYPSLLTTSLCYTLLALVTQYIILPTPQQCEFNRNHWRLGI